MEKETEQKNKAIPGYTTSKYLHMFPVFQQWIMKTLEEKLEICSKNRE